MVKVVAKKKIMEDKIKEVIKLYEEMIEATRKENGCIKYELYQDQNDPSVVAMIEEWESKEALEAHKNEEHFLRIVPEIGKRCLSTELNVYNKLL